MLLLVILLALALVTPRAGAESAVLDMVLSIFRMMENS